MVAIIGSRHAEVLEEEAAAAFMFSRVDEENEKRRSLTPQGYVETPLTKGYGGYGGERDRSVILCLLMDPESRGLEY